MQSEGLCPDSITLSCVLKACGSAGAIGKGEQIHREILRRRLLDRDLVLGNALIDMYAKCGELGKARGVAEALPVRDAVSWCTLIAGYVQEGLGREALDCFEKMQSEGLTANAITLICVLRACGIEGSIAMGARIHREMAARGLLERDPELGNALVDMYVKCGDLGRAREVLRELPRRDVVSWSALIAGYAERGKIGDALRCLEHMQREGLSPNAVTFACLLKACASIGALDKGQEIHRSIIDMGLLENDSLLGNALLDMYAKCGALAEARRVLEALLLPARSTVSWNTLLAGFAQQGRCDEALSCLDEMRRDGFSPNQVTFLCVVNAFNHSGFLAEAQSHFADMSRNHGLAPELQHHTCIVAGLGRGAQFDEAVSVIKVMPSSALSSPAVWVALLGGCRECGNVKLATLAFDQALQIDPCCAPAYVLMTNIFFAAGMYKDAAKLRSMVPKPGV
jgi:pentatricopeptide repeat protein